MTDAVPRKRPWELHAIVVLFALALGYSLSSDRMETTHQLVLGGLTISLVGLFRGHRFAWWTTSTAFLILVFLTMSQSGDAIQQYGWRNHPKLWKIHATTLLAIVSFLLLILCWIRGAIPAKAAPLLEELPAVGKVLAVVAPILFAIAGVFSLATVALFDTGRHHSERSAYSLLRTLTSAEADFRANDRDWNQVTDFWTADVRGLWSIVPANGKEPVKLIELTTAAADGNPAAQLSPPVPAEILPRSGAWFSTLIEDRSEVPIRPYGVRNIWKFGFICYPDDRVTGLKEAGIINENNTCFRLRLMNDIRPSDKYPPGPFTDPQFTGWPSDEELKARWRKED